MKRKLSHSFLEDTDKHISFSPPNKKQKLNDYNNEHNEHKLDLKDNTSSKIIGVDDDFANKSEIDAEQQEIKISRHETSYIINYWTKYSVHKNVPSNIFQMIDDFANKWTFDTEQDNIKINGNGKIAHRKYNGCKKQFPVKIGYQIDLSSDHIHKVFKFGLGAKHIYHFLGVGLKFTIKTDTRGEKTYCFHHLPFYGASFPSYVWDYVHCSGKMLSQQEGVIMVKFNTKSKTVKFYIDGHDNEMFVRFQKEVVCVQFFINMGSMLYGTFYPDLVKLTSCKIDFI
eukprot:289755_1